MLKAGWWTVSHRGSFAGKTTADQKHFAVSENCLYFVIMSLMKKQTIKLSFIPVICFVPNRLRQPPFFCSSWFWWNESRPCFVTLCCISISLHLKCRHTQINRSFHPFHAVIFHNYCTVQDNSSLDGCTNSLWPWWLTTFVQHQPDFILYLFLLKCSQRHQAEDTPYLMHNRWIWMLLERIYWTELWDNKSDRRSSFCPLE